MLPEAVRRLVDDWAIKPGERAVVVSADARGLEVASVLERAGVEIAAVADLRSADPPHIAARGRHGRLESVDVGAGPVGCDLLVVSGGRQPAYSLLAQAGARVEYDESRGIFVPVEIPAGIEAVGSVLGPEEPAAVPSPSYGDGRGDRCKQRSPRPSPQGARRSGSSGPRTEPTASIPAGISPRLSSSRTRAPACARTSRPAGGRRTRRVDRIRQARADVDRLEPPVPRAAMCGGSADEGRQQRRSRLPPARGPRRPRGHLRGDHDRSLPGLIARQPANRLRQRRLDEVVGEHERLLDRAGGDNDAAGAHPVVAGVDRHEAALVDPDARAGASNWLPPRSSTRRTCPPADSASAAALSTERPPPITSTSTRRCSVSISPAPGRRGHAAEAATRRKRSYSGHARRHRVSSSGSRSRPA